MPLKRLVSLLLPEPPPGDLAFGDWSPVPTSATALPDDPVEWLVHDDVPPPRPVLNQVPLEPEAPPPRPDVMQCFSPEELAIIQEQRQQEQRQAVSEPTPPAPQPRPARQAQARQAQAPQAQAPQAEAPQTEAAPGRRWLDVLRSCGEHLSEAELKIIRQQLAAT